jgi:hypothetical protein
MTPGRERQPSVEGVVFSPISSNLGFTKPYLRFKAGNQAIKTLCNVFIWGAERPNCLSGKESHKSWSKLRVSADLGSTGSDF